MSSPGGMYEHDGIKYYGDGREVEPTIPQPPTVPASSPEAKCWERGYHNYEEFIDPRSGGFIRCKDCGKQVDCEDPDGDLG